MHVHVDINSYFATLLQQEVPSLRGKPIGVIKEAGRTCIIAASNEAKLYGVRTGTSSADALARCPGIMLLPANFDMYGSATRRLVELFQRLSPTPEIFSLDEAFIPYDELRELHPDAVAFGTYIQQAIRTELGEWVACSVGIGRTRLLAKMAGETAKKGSVTLVDKEKERELLITTPFSDVCGVGWRLEKRLATLGVTRPFEISLIPKEDLRRHFGPFWSEELFGIANGEEPSQLRRLAEPPAAAKSIGRSITLFDLSNNKSDQYRVLCNLASEVMHKARVLRLCGRRISIAVIGQERSWSRHITLITPIRQTKELFDQVKSIFARWSNEFAIIRFVVHLDLLEPWETQQLPFWHEWWRREKTETAVDTINRRYGIYTLRSGRLLSNATLIRPEVTGFLGDKSYQLLTE